MDTKLEIIKILKEMQHPDGGFYGVYKSSQNLLASYASVFTIINLGIKEGYDIINIPKMKEYLVKMKNNNFNLNNLNIIKDKKGDFLLERSEINSLSENNITIPGSFSLYRNGENDLKGTYCAVAIADILNILDDELVENIADNIKNCQTYEGGFASDKYNECHGGYSYCAISTLIILKQVNIIDINSFIRWLVNRQILKEGGFNGRTNKLVDSCYSFWIGSIFNMLMIYDNKLADNMELLYDNLSLQAYILFCCQDKLNGGLYNKPGDKSDIYHSNYASTGLILSMESLDENNFNSNLINIYSNKFPKINPLYGILDEKVKKAKEYFNNSTSF